VEYLVLIRVFRPYLTTLLFLSLSLNSGWGGEIVVATSANVSYAIDALIERFNRVHPEIKVKKVVSSSGKLTSQILHKAPYDIFLSADTIYPKRLYSEGVCFKPKIYAKGCLAIFSKKERDFHRGLNILKEKSIKRVAIANPKVAPYGRATVKALKSAKIYNQISSKVVYADSISQTLSYILKVTEIGVVAKSLLLSPKMSVYREGKEWMEVDRTLYSPIKQGAVLLKSSKNLKESKIFYRFLFSEDAKEVLREYGYLTE
jgi:molybdate transport system substrate-binding protein